MKSKVIGIIPARYASTRFPGKLLIPLLGKTLLQRTFENAQQISCLDELIVATDDLRIYNHVKQFGGQVAMTSLDCPTGTDRLAEMLQKRDEWRQTSAVINIQGDEPCLNPQAVDAAVQLLLQDKEAHAATLATPLKNEEEASHSSIVKCVIDQRSNALYFSRSLIPGNKKNSFNKERTYYRHIGLYVYRPDFLLHYQTLPATPLQLEEDLEQLKILEHGYRLKVALTEEACIGVDTPEDLKKVEQWLCKQNIFL